jgi:23S rRNA pseudouridine1911/1915/1917 synthase
MAEKIHYQLIILDNLAGMRLDQALAKLLPDHSRTQIKTWLDNGNIMLDKDSPKAKTIVIGGELVVIDAEIKSSHQIFEAQAIPLRIIDEDDQYLVIDKPAGMVVHPAAGNFSQTLLNALLHYLPDLQKLPRAGIIHRLDKDTSGLLIVAKTPLALKQLSQQLKARTLTRIYQAIINGILVSGGTINEPIARHPLQRTKMSVQDTGKEAITHYRVIERYRAHTRIKVQLETGRTHQIRVHMAHAHHPILGDPTYGGRLQLPKGATPELINMLRNFKRQALHACELQFAHPLTGKLITCTAPLPVDMQELIKVLKYDNNCNL